MHPAKGGHPFEVKLRPHKGGGISGLGRRFRPIPRYAEERAAPPHPQGVRHPPEEWEVIYLNMHHDECRKAILSSSEENKQRIPSDISPLLCKNCWELVIKGLDAQLAIGKRIRVPDKTGLLKWETFYLKCREAYDVALGKKSWVEARKALGEQLGIKDEDVDFHFDTDWFRPILHKSCDPGHGPKKMPFRKAFHPYQSDRELLFRKRLDPVQYWQHCTGHQERNLTASRRKNTII